jgi:hypothetical protein
MRTSKLLELAALLGQYAETVGGPQRLMAHALARVVDEDARDQERAASKKEKHEARNNRSVGSGGT